jgi:8-oxo-dGTP diphosphatase
MALLYSLLILPRNGKIPLLRRNKPGFGKGFYSLPGGKVEDKETAREAIVREAQEELGITVSLDDLEFVHVFDRNGETDHIVVFVFKVDRWQGEISNKEPDKHDDLAWFSPDALPEAMLPSHGNVLADIKNSIRYSEQEWR